MGCRCATPRDRDNVSITCEACGRRGRYGVFPLDSASMGDAGLPDILTDADRRLSKAGKLPRGSCKATFDWPNRAADHARAVSTSQRAMIAKELANIEGPGQLRGIPQICGIPGS